jgi:hypothetical protein
MVVLSGIAAGNLGGLRLAGLGLVELGFGAA